MRAHPDNSKMKEKICFHASRGMITTTHTYDEPASPPTAIIPLQISWLQPWSTEETSEDRLAALW